MEKIAIIVAGGVGTRMNAVMPKQFMLLGGYPVLMHTIMAFSSFDKDMRIIVVLPETQLDKWKEICREYHFKERHELGLGGETRFHSVRNNLEHIPDESLVAIHDGVRPLIDGDTIRRCFDQAGKTGNAVPCIEIPETLRRITDGANEWVDRSVYRLIQTPQVFRGSLIKKAYAQEYQSFFTDDAVVLESLGIPIHLVEGSINNLKITFQRDLNLASALLSAGNWI
ncbi:MAG: 2-C-methyl-D-erythritol 4-phosphate cytidylyltransferase [Bacteroidales bacterium]|nr:2-C-methyl-D-erythritol 4-phosphate cytidylyltransferase [Bacteroidales bacterium]